MTRRVILTAAFGALAATVLTGMGGGGDAGAINTPTFNPPPSARAATKLAPEPRSPDAAPAANTKACNGTDVSAKECRKPKR